VSAGLNRPSLRAIEALSKAIAIGPTLVRESLAFGGVSVCAWETPWLEGFTLPETDDLILALHSRGSRDVRWRLDARLSEQRSFPGLVTLIPPGHSVAYHTGGPVSFTTVHINRAALQSLHDGREPVMQDRFAFRDNFVVSCIASLLQEARCADRWSQRFVGAVTEALVLHLLRLDPVESEMVWPASPEQRIAATRNLIEANLDGNLSLARLAADVGMSRAHFARVFRQVVDVPPHHYVMKRRLDHAATLLSNTQLALKVVAQDAGFCSQAHLTQLFKKHRGVTPQAYRRSCRQVRE
jgi:AraC family transcriptional regulator